MAIPIKPVSASKRGNKPLTDDIVYLKGNGSFYPAMDYCGASYVVSSVTSDNGKEGTITTNYSYRGLKIHLQGKGSLGFTETTMINPTIGIMSINTYDYDSTYFYPYASLFSLFFFLISFSKTNGVTVCSAAI